MRQVFQLSLHLKLPLPFPVSGGWVLLGTVLKLPGQLPMAKVESVCGNVHAEL